MEFSELVMKRRTVRRFEDAPVDREVPADTARLGGRSLGGGAVRMNPTNRPAG